MQRLASIADAAARRSTLPPPEIDKRLRRLQFCPTPVPDLPPWIPDTLQDWSTTVRILRASCIDNDTPSDAPGGVTGDAASHPNAGDATSGTAAKPSGASVASRRAFSSHGNEAVVDGNAAGAVPAAAAADVETAAAATTATEAASEKLLLEVGRLDSWYAWLPYPQDGTKGPLAFAESAQQAEQQQGEQEHGEQQQREEKQGEQQLAQQHTRLLQLQMDEGQSTSQAQDLQQAQNGFDNSPRGSSSSSSYSSQPQPMEPRSNQGATCSGCSCYLASVKPEVNGSWVLVEVPRADCRPSNGDDSGLSKLFVTRGSTTGTPGTGSSSTGSSSSSRGGHSGTGSTTGSDGRSLEEEILGAASVGEAEGEGEEDGGCWTYAQLIICLQVRGVSTSSSS